jgi:DNA repair exonuclease SbcCD ATPase subunit
MVLAHFQASDTDSVERQIEEADDEIERLWSQIDEIDEQTEECHRAGTAIISALQVSMAPLMAELAVERGRAEELPQVDDIGRTCEDIDAEIDRLKTSTSEYQTKANQLQTASRKRATELERTRAELASAKANLDYETQRVKHQHASRQMGFDKHGESWAGLGPTGVGMRTLEVRAEAGLREVAEARAARLQRDVMKLANDHADHQSTIAKLGKRLGRVRGLVLQRDQQLAELSQSTANLQSKLMQSGGDGDTSALDLDLGHGSTLTSRKSLGRKNAAGSTGRLPQLSF